MFSNCKVLITGGSGMLGEHTSKVLKENFSGVEIFSPTKVDLNLFDTQKVKEYISDLKPDYVFHYAATVYGLGGNAEHPLEMLSNNVRINDAVLSACSIKSVNKIFVASTVAAYAYPYANIPLNENDFFSGEPHQGEYGYAIAKRLAFNYLKILNQKYSKKYVYGLYTNLYGPNDRFNIETGHVIPSLICKMFSCIENNNTFDVWGNPNTTRDFMHVNDAARAAIKLMCDFNGIANIGSGIETSMGSLVNSIADASNYKGLTNWQSDMPVGIPSRYLDISILKSIGFDCKYDLSSGIKDTWEWYVNEIKNNNFIRG